MALLASTEAVAFDRRKCTVTAMTTYDDQNVFAKVLRSEIPRLKVYENDRVLAFLDIMPRSPGHTLVIPKAPERGILDIAEDDLAEVVRIAKRIAIAAMKAFDAEGIIIQQFSEPASGRWSCTCTCMSCRSRRSSNCCRRRREGKIPRCSPTTPGG
jgi:histidine triad (HIT) family protein